MPRHRRKQTIRHRSERKVFEVLESRLVLAVSAAEQSFVYALNRARHDPIAYQLERSLPVDLGYVAPQPPLAINTQLMNSSEFKSSEMASLNYFSHTSVTGETPNELARRFGFELPYSLTVGSTTYVIGSTGNQIESLAAGYATADLALEGLIIDEGVSPPGHRNHLLGIEPFYATAREIGVGYAYGASAYYRHYWSIHATRSTDPGPFLTGVAFSDGNANSRYNEGEGFGGVTITATGPAGTFTTSSLTAGGWSIKVPKGQYVVTASGGSWSGLSSVAVAVGADNIEVDFASGQANGWVNFTRYANTAPVLAPSGGRNVSPVVIGTVPAGTTIGDLLGTSFSDADPLPTAGIAITAATSGTATGTWEYSIDGGSSWVNLGSPTAAFARLLRQQDLVRFVPDSGSPQGTASLTYRAWDQTSGATGGVVNTSTTGGSSAFSAATATASATAIAANTAPVLTPSGSGTFDSVAEDTVSPPGTTVATIMGTSFSDVDPGTAAGLALFGTTDNSSGAWSYSIDAGISWTPVGAVSASSALLLRASDRLRFVPSNNYSGSASISYRGWDQSSAAAGTRVDLSSGSFVGGSTAYSTATATVTISITPVNDAPSYVDGSSALRMKPIAINSSFNFIGTTVADILGNCVSDPDSSPLTGMALIGLGSGGTFYWSTNNGASWSGGTVSPTFVTLLRSTDRIGFAPNSGFSGDATVTFRLWDQTSGAAGFNQANLSNPSASTGGTSAYGADVLTARIFVGAAGTAPSITLGAVVRSAGGRTADSIPIGASRAVTGLDVGDFTLTRDSVPVPLTGAIITGSGTSFVLSGLANATLVGGSYQLAIKSSLTGMADDAGNRVASAPVASFSVAAASPPSDIRLSNTSIVENAVANAVVGTLTTVDADAGDIFTYALVPGAGDADNSMFTIVAGQLLAKNPLDFELRSDYLVRIRSTDGSGLACEKSFSIMVTDVLDDYIVVVDSGASATATALPSGSLSRLVKRGTGTLVLNTTSGHAGGTIIEAGTVRVTNGSAFGTGGVTVLSGATMTIASNVTSVTIASLDVRSGGRVDIDSAQVVVANGLTRATLLSRLAAANGDGTWNGTSGIGSSAAAAARLALEFRSIGWFENGDGSFVIRYAATGDTNIDGSLDILDAANVLAGDMFDRNAAASWTEGDFNYDGVVDILDIADFVAADLFDKGVYASVAAADSSVAGDDTGISTLISAAVFAEFSASTRTKSAKTSRSIL